MYSLGDVIQSFGAPKGGSSKPPRTPVLDVMRQKEKSWQSSEPKAFGLSHQWSTTTTGQQYQPSQFILLYVLHTHIYKWY